MFKLSTIHTRFTALALLLVFSSLLAACDSGGAATPVPPTPAAAATPTAGAGGSTGNTVNVTLAEFAIDPATINVAAGHVKFNVTNSGKYPHNFGVMVNGQNMKTANIQPGSSATLEMDLTAGTYSTLCDIPTHKDKGMAGSIVVK